MIRHRLASQRQPRRGAVAVFIVICLTMLMAFVAISLDGGMLLLERRHAQMTADAAAMAAASVMYNNYPTYSGVGPSPDVTNAALAVASANGYSNDGVTSTVTVHNPPVSGPYKGQAGYVEVIVQYNLTRFFSGNIGGSGTLPIQARAVAQGAWISVNAGVMVLDLSGQGTLSTQGNGAFTESGGPVIVNSNNASAVVDTGGATMKGQEFDITGGTKVGNHAVLVTSPVANQVFTGVHPTPDPLAYLPVPTKPPAGTETTTNLGQGNTMYTFSPGSYSNLPNFKSGDIVVLQQASANSNGGIFYIDGGGFKSTGASIIMDSTTSGGVMIYNKPASSADSEKIQITGNSAGTVSLSPLTSGTYSGLVLWQDRTSTLPVKVEGNGSFTVSGTFYAAGGTLQVNGNGGTYTGSDGSAISGSQIGSQYISNDLTVGGNGNIYIKYSGTGSARSKMLRLVE